jgi:large subunit ribosomal protein L18e
MTQIHKNQQLAQLIINLKQASKEHKAPLWSRVADDLAKPTRSRREVNVYKINQNTKDKDFVIVPGKVLGMGELGHSVSVAALSFSQEARVKIEKTGNTMTIEELLKKHPRAQHIKILG